MAQSKLIKLLNVDPKFFYYNGNPNNKRNGGGLGNFTQKSIQSGGDRPGNSNSGQPYIVTPIPQKPNSANAVDDGYIRGGVTLADKASIIDKERIKRFLKDKPKGTLFIQRQTGLQFSNPKLEVKKYGNTGEGLLGGLIAGVFNVVNELIPGPTRLYNAGFNTLAQIGENAYGTHFNRHGILPVQDDNTKYLAVVRHNNQGNGNNNRLVGLKNKLIRVVEPPSNFLNTINFLAGVANTFLGTNISTKGLQPADLTIDDYLGGPGSLYGNGRTLIKRYDITGGGKANKYLPIKGANFSRIQTLSFAYNGSADPNLLNALSLGFLGGAISRPTERTTKDTPTNQTAVFYAKNIPAGANGTSVSPTQRTYGELKLAVERLKAIPQTKINPTTGANQSLDPTSVNYKYYGTRRLLTNDQTVAIYNNTLDLDRRDPDIMTVSFQAIYPFGTEITSGYHYLFPAYIKGFRDNFDANWNEYNYAGRSETFYTYNKFKRSVSFNLDIPCFNKTQLYEKHRALGQLASTTAGAYNENGLLGGVLLKVKLGGYLNNEYAILNSINYEIPDDSSWDLDGYFNSTGTTTQDKIDNINNRNQLAMYLKANISLTIIHSELPQYQIPKDNDPNQKPGFFGHLPNPINSYLKSDYKTQPSTAI
jgi:hypothetical protein